MPHIGYDGLKMYKVMGLAPYGEPRFDLSSIWRYEGNLSFSLNPHLIESKYQRVSLHPSERIYKLSLIYSRLILRRNSIEPIRQIDKDIVASAQHHLEIELLKFLMT